MKSRAQELEEWGTDVIFGKARGFRATIMRLLLRIVSWGFRMIVKLRLYLFNSRVLDQKNLGTLVISIGNITVGGTGKTPIVELLAKTLQSRGRKVSILTRGYKSHPLETSQFWFDKNGKRVKNLPKIASDGTTRFLGPLYAGDEPYMLAKNLNGIPVLVDKNRIKSGIFAIEQFGSDTLILDDGMQYIKLDHEIDIVLVDCNAPFGTGNMLPRGTLREPKKNLSRADYIILTKSEGKPQDELVAKIQKYNQFADIIISDHRPQYIENVFTGERLPLGEIKNKWVACLSGIARPESFENSIRKLGGRVEITRRYPDHHWFSKEDLESFYERCAERAMQMIITTEKDAVRLFKPDQIEVPVYFLRIEVEILQGQEEWNQCINRICNLSEKSPQHQWP